MEYRKNWPRLFLSEVKKTFFFGEMFHAEIFAHLYRFIFISTGLSSEERLHGVKYIIESFVGCIRDMVLSSGKSASDLLPIRPLIATKHENVKEGCIDKYVFFLKKERKESMRNNSTTWIFQFRCRTRENLCFVPDQCVNHYNSLTCDCFGTNYEGERCDVYST